MPHKVGANEDVGVNVARLVKVRPVEPRGRHGARKGAICRGISDILSNKKHTQFDGAAECLEHLVVSVREHDALRAGCKHV